MAQNRTKRKISEVETLRATPKTPSPCIQKCHIALPKDAPFHCITSGSQVEWPKKT